jgi:hypothetical protein
VTETKKAPQARVPAGLDPEQLLTQTETGGLEPPAACARRGSSAVHPTPARVMARKGALTGAVRRVTIVAGNQRIRAREWGAGHQRGTVTRGMGEMRRRWEMRPGGTDPPGPGFNSSG